LAWSAQPLLASATEGRQLRISAAAWLAAGIGRVL
jgi:hypothetical protein